MSDGIGFELSSLKMPDDQKFQFDTRIPRLAVVVVPYGSRSCGRDFQK